jgi:hypothetical protein
MIFILSNWLFIHLSKSVAVTFGYIAILKKSWFETADPKTQKCIKRHIWIHYQQFKRNPWTHYFRYYNRPDYALECEIEAFAHNIIKDNISKTWVADYCYKNYALFNQTIWTKAKVKKELDRQIMKVKWQYEKEANQ